MSMTKKDTVQALITALSALGGPKGMVAGQIANGAIRYGPRAYKAIRKVVGKVRNARKNSKRNRGGGQSSRANNVTAPVAIGRMVQTGKPTTTMKGGVTTVTHSEYLGDVASNTTLTTALESLAINPTDSATFPWLSTIALNYQRYAFKRLRFRFVTRCPTSTDGTMYLAFLTDPVEPLPDDKVTMMNIAGAVSGVNWTSIDFEVTKNILDAVGGTRMMRDPAGTYDAESLPAFDVGRLLYASVRAVATVGEIYVDYVCDLIDPATNVPAGTNWQYIRVSDATAVTPNSSPDATIPMFASSENSTGWYWLGWGGVNLGSADGDEFVPDLDVPPGTYYLTFVYDVDAAWAVISNSSPIAAIGVTSGGVEYTRTTQIFNSNVPGANIHSTGLFEGSLHHPGGPMQWTVTRQTIIGATDVEDIDMSQIHVTLTRINDGAVGVAPMDVVADHRKVVDTPAHRANKFAESMRGLAAKKVSVAPAAKVLAVMPSKKSRPAA